MAAKTKPKPKPMRQVLLYFPHSIELGKRTPSVELAEKPSRVWTLAGKDPDVPPSLPISPVHGWGCFLEDFVHDWNWRKGQFHYASRVSSGQQWLLLEYEK